MKKFLYILLFCLPFQALFGQDEQPDGPGGKLREKMVEYIQTKLDLDKSEAEKFQPVFFEYIKERRNTNKQFKDDRIKLQQKTAELRLRYRDQFKTIVGEKRSNDVFQHETEFIKKAVDVLKDRREENQERRAIKGKNSKLLPN